VIYCSFDDSTEESLAEELALVEEHTKALREEGTSIDTLETEGYIAALVVVGPLCSLIPCLDFDW
jgi:hypothetical protein